MPTRREFLLPPPRCQVPPPRKPIRRAPLVWSCRSQREGPRIPLRGSWLSRCESRWPVVIENVTGADGTIGTIRAARAKPDGYTLCLGTTGTHVLNGAFYSLPYDVLSDFLPVSPLVINPHVLYARRTITARNLNELVAWLKANKASAGIIAGDFRLITMFFQRQIGATLTLVPYRGGAPAVQDLAAGQIDICRVA